MYDINKTVSTIKATAKEQNVSITTMLEEIGIFAVEIRHEIRHEIPCLIGRGFFHIFFQKLID